MSRSDQGTRRSTILSRRANRASGLSLFFKRFLVFMILIGFVAGGVYYLTETRWIEQTSQKIVTTTHAKLARLGLRVENVLIEGREHVSREGLKTLVKIKRGDSIFAHDLDQIKSDIAKISWVKHVSVERKLPNTIYIHITERKPLALWQREGRLSLIDEEGVVLTNRELARFRDLIVIVGEGAPAKAAELLALLNAEPELKARVNGAKWVGNRRWDLTLKNGIVIRLPEEDTGEALYRLAQTQKSEQVLDRKLQSIDLRDPLRIVVQTAPGAVDQFEASMIKDRNI